MENLITIKSDFSTLNFLFEPPSKKTASNGKQRPLVGDESSRVCGEVREKP